MTTFRKVEPFVISRGLDESKVAMNCLFEDDRLFFDCAKLTYDEAIALCDWLASATGHYPKEPKQ